MHTPNPTKNCSQVDMMFIGPTTSKEMPTRSCVMYNIVSCYMCTLVQQRPTTENNAKREEWLILLCTYLLSHTRHAPISDSRPRSTHLLRDRVLSLHPWAMLDACNERKHCHMYSVCCKYNATATPNYLLHTIYTANLKVLKLV